MAALEPYTYTTLQTILKREFGNPDDPSLDFDALVKEAINRALALLWTEKSFWDFSLHPFAVNCEARVTRVGGVLNPGSDIVSWSGIISPSVKRYELRLEGSSEAFVVKDHTAATSNCVIDKPFTGAATSTASLSFYHSYIALPDDLAFIQTIRIASQWNRKLDYRQGWTFKALEGRGPVTLTDSWPTVYTVLRDPLHQEFDLKYLMLYPRLGALTRIEGLYFATPLSLVAGSDTVPLPHGHRPAVIFKAASLIATQMGDLERAGIYEAHASRVIDALKRAGPSADDDTTELDLSGAMPDFVDGAVQQIVTP